MLSSTAAAHLSIMRHRPITVQMTIHSFIKGALLVCKPKRKQYREGMTLTYDYSTFIKAEPPPPPNFLEPFFVIETGYLVFNNSEINMIMAWKQSCISAITAQELFVFFSCPPSFLGLFFPCPSPSPTITVLLSATPL